MNANDRINKVLDGVSTAVVAVALTPGVLTMHILNAPVRLAMRVSQRSKFRGGTFPETSQKTQGT